MAANSVRCPRDRGESVKGGLPPPVHKKVMTNRNSPPRAAGAQGSFDCRREAPGGSGAGAQFLPTRQPELVQRCAPAPGPLDPDAGPHREDCPEVGVPLPARHRAGRGAALSCLCATLCRRRLAMREKTDGSELRSLPTFSGECVKGGILPFHKTVTTNRNSPKRAEGAQGSFDSGAKRRAVRERGLNSFPLNNPNWSSDVPPLPNRSTRFTCRVPSRRRRSCQR